MEKFIGYLNICHVLLWVVFQLVLHPVPNAQGGGLEVQTERPDNVALRVSWEKEDEVKICSGSLSLKTVGDMSLESLSEKTYAIFQKYANYSGTALYNYTIQCVEKEPDPPYKGCPTVVRISWQWLRSF